MPRKWKIYGPEPHRRKWRVRVYPPDGPGRSRGFDTKEKAQAYREEVEAELTRTDAQYRAAQLFAEAEAALTEARACGDTKKAVSDAIVGYELYMREHRGSAPNTIETAIYRLKGLLQPVMSTNVARVTKNMAREAYRARVASGKSAATHRNELKETRRLWRWLLEEGWVVNNPWMKVEPVGKVAKGKEQLRDHEASVLERLALERARGIGIGSDHWAENRRVGALAVLVALYLGQRPKEVVHLTVRDVGPSVLYVDGTKNGNAKRRVRIPEVLSDLLQERAAECRELGQTLLFPFERDWVRAWAGRLCKAAGLPRVCAQALRGMHATLATEAGMTGEAVARQLGHGSTGVTYDHYIDPEAAESARIRAAVDHLNATKVGRENSHFLAPSSVRNTPRSEKTE